MRKAQAISRFAGSDQEAITGDVRALAQEVGATKFLGYEGRGTSGEGVVKAILVGGARVQTAKEGDKVQLVFDQTPFYAESGGQIGDAGEVVTPAGNWSSWPPHKHDEERPGAETALEEIYYVETRATDPRGTDPVGYLRVYGSSPQRPVDVVAEVRTGDVVLVPHGWHGPAVAAPDADLYYLNVMAGPGPERAWRICDDPAHAWVRERWSEETVDPRLPVGGEPR